MDNISQTLKPQYFWQSQAFQGAFWKMVSCAAFAGINVIVRYLGGGGSWAPETVLPANVMIFFQNVFGFLFMLPFMFPRPTSQFWMHWKTQYPKLHFARVLTAVLGILFMYLSLQKMPIAESVALSFTGPAFTLLGAWFLLGESLDKQRALAIVFCILGSFIITRPDLVLFTPGSSRSALGWSVLYPLLSAAMLALSKLFTRQLAKAGEKTEQLTLFLLFGMIPFSFILALFEWVTPDLSHWPWLMLLGFLAVLAHMTFSKAYALAEVTFLMPFGFSKFLFSLLLGYFCFLEIPSLSLWLGMGMIGFSLVCLAYKISYKIRLYSIARRFISN